MNLDNSAQYSASLWTASGRGAVATIHVNGIGVEDNVDRALRDRSSSSHGATRLRSIPFVAANGKSLSNQPVNRIVFGRWGTEPTEDVVICRISPEVLEIHCHGGVAAANRILADLKQMGANVVTWDEQLQDQAGRLKRECCVALSKATTIRTATCLLTQETTWRKWIADVRHLVAIGSWKQASEAVQQVLRWSHFGRHLIEPYRVVLTGKPNVGKSSLINALVGFQRSIVFDQPGTTRDVVTSEAAWNGWPVLLADTAGLRDAATGLEEGGIALAIKQIAHADLVILVHDASESVGEIDDAFLARQLVNAESKTVRVGNKIDLRQSPSGSVLESSPADFYVSARTGEGVEVLIEGLSRRLVPAIPVADVPLLFSAYLGGWLRELHELITLESTELIEKHLRMNATE